MHLNPPSAKVKSAGPEEAAHESAEIGGQEVGDTELNADGGGTRESDTIEASEGNDVLVGDSKPDTLEGSREKANREAIERLLAAHPELTSDQVQRLLVQTTNQQIGSQNWIFLGNRSARNVTMEAGKYKCNLFVYEMLDKTRGLMNTTYGADGAAALTNPERIRSLPLWQSWGAGPIGADTWATANTIPGWTRVEGPPQPGDVIVRQEGGQLNIHMGIVTYIGPFVDPAPDGKHQGKLSTLATTSATTNHAFGKPLGIQQNGWGGRPKEEVEGNRPFIYWRPNVVIELQRREGRPSSYKGEKLKEPYKLTK